MKNRFSRLTALGMLTALVVVLQTAATFIRFGSFPITLTLIPIVVAGALYGVGSGALIGTETAPDEKTYREELFGTDPAHNTLITRTNTESVRLPVFGVKRGTDAMLGAISAGAATAAVRAQAGNERVGYSSVYAEFAIRGAETVEDAKVGTHRYIQIFSDEKNAEERLAVDYYPLAGEDAGYVGMAARYRRYLTDGGSYNVFFLLAYGHMEFLPNECKYLVQADGRFSGAFRMDQNRSETDLVSFDPAAASMAEQTAPTQISEILRTAHFQTFVK